MYSGTKFYPVKTKLVPNPNEFEGPALIEKTNGEVDQIDLQEFIAKCKMYGGN